MIGLLTSTTSSMRRRIGLRFLAMVCAVFMLAPVLPAQADELTWYFRSNHPNIVDVELYSQARNHVWPGNDRVYSLDDSDTNEITIQCSFGESICYGAWVRGDSSTYWGVGLNDRDGCERCCYTCDGGETNEIVLNP